MTASAPQVSAPPEREPVHHRLTRIAAWIVGVVVVLAFLRVCGVDVWGWLQNLWDTLSEISLGYIVLGCLFQGLQTFFTALGWYGILNYAYRGQVTFMPVLASYAAGVALNNFLPANIGTLVTLLMYVAIIEHANFPGVLAGYVVQKIFYFIIGTLIYIYLFAELAGSFSFQFGGIRDAISGHWVLILVIVVGGGFLIYVLLRSFWAWFKKMWAKAKEGAAILGDLHAYLRTVLLPQVLGYISKVLVVIVFLAAYSIPITFGSVMSVLGSNQLANILSVTPGGVGVNQAFNTFALGSYTDSTTATAYSVAQQLITTAFNVLFALALVCYVFGWSGGSQLVRQSYAGAKEQAREQKEKRRLRREGAPGEPEEAAS
jgi:uncharacterized membrane protein YbhN (UPF0104 family)